MLLPSARSFSLCSLSSRFFSSSADSNLGAEVEGPCFRMRSLSSRSKRFFSSSALSYGFEAEPEAFPGAPSLVSKRDPLAGPGPSGPADFGTPVSATVGVACRSLAGGSIGSDPPVCGAVVSEGVIVGAGSGVGARFKDPVWRVGDDTGGDVASFDDVVCDVVGIGTGMGTGGSWSVVPPAFLGGEGWGAGLLWPRVESSSAWVSPKLFVSLRLRSTAACCIGKSICPGLHLSSAFWTAALIAAVSFPLSYFLVGEGGSDGNTWRTCSDA